ncbi:MAG: enoyl-CoA hydratase/isomerase family protein [Myxococcales bacterium]|nr:enoyl-CoA hydratase/isomerase family protein [Myxococcales bacterium]MCB9733685.1 enoyl-CoA hydratase/isomerase family protein [Deltaproteobacteria bacterium]
MSEPITRVERDGAVARLIIDNPAARNGLTADACRHAAAALREAGADPAVRVVVVEGAGGHFCSGADLRAAGALVGMDDDAVRAYVREGFQPLVEAVWGCAKPTLAVVRGACVGFGFDLALACDLRLAAGSAQLAQVFSRIALVPDGGSSFTLPRLVGLGLAMEMMLLGEKIDGHRAAALGLVNRAVPEEELAALAADWTARLAAGPPIAFRLGRENLRAGALGGTLADALDREAAAQVSCLRSADLGRGVAAFFARKAPEFKGD